MNRSLRWQLLGPLVWVWLLGALLAAYGAFNLASYAGGTAYDRTLQDEAGAIATQIHWTDRGPLLELSTQTQEMLAWDSADRNAFMVTDAEGRVLAGVAGLPVPEDVSGSFDRPQVFDADYQGEPVRGAMYSIRSPMLDTYVTVVVVETRRKRADLVREVQVAILMPTLALGLLTFLLLALGIRRGVAPLRRIAGEVERRAPQDLRPLPLDDVPAEAVPLIERLNALLANVSRSFELQRRFVADAAHQLRTPVAGIRVLSQELQHELAAIQADASTQAMLQALVASTERMSRLIGQLLNLARSDAALRNLAAGELQHIDVLPVIREAAEPLLLRASREGKQVSLEAPDGPGWARAHPVWLAEVVSNLLDNALRYGGPNIELRVTPREGWLDIEVRDDGPGIMLTQRELVFEPFWRGERADTRGPEGTGLGLAIVKEIVLGMRGRLRLASRPELAGTCFTVSLPV
ncbi:sensor histidine kinase [Caldimonas brevitalea]|uniref:histidine kinase n=1 Tax=Caldimonas brevitalea TaxID=413882 RepID=A0A0G3BQ07_9BURK|nr:sensor histidine kinase [Caldimonas brevitalea]AKJ28645.1 two-component system, OmpR family, sensor histidine kinase TctE [Caldimonas brevitalea]